MSAAWRSGRLLLGIAAALIVLTAAFHCAGWFLLRGQIAADTRPIVRLLWFCVDLDWLVAAFVWALAGWKGAAVPHLAVVAISAIPLGAAVWLLFVVGPAFFGVYLLLVAAACAIIGSHRLARS